MKFLIQLIVLLPVNESCHEAPLDLIFIIDGSNSVSSEDFIKVKQFVSKLVQVHQIGPNDTQISVVSF